MKHKKIIDDKKFYSAHVPYATKENKGKYAVVDDDGNWSFGSGESGSSLPKVTSADNGKVLGVDNAQWKAVSPSEQIVFLSEPQVDPDTGAWTLSKTWNEIRTLILNKHLVYLIDPTLEDSRIWALIQTGAVSGSYWLIWRCGTNSFTLENTNANSNVFAYSS